MHLYIHHPWLSEYLALLSVSHFVVAIMNYHYQFSVIKLSFNIKVLLYNSQNQWGPMAPLQRSSTVHVFSIIRTGLDVPEI